MLEKNENAVYWMEMLKKIKYYQMKALLWCKDLDKLYEEAHDALEKQELEKSEKQYQKLLSQIDLIKCELEKNNLWDNTMSDDDKYYAITEELGRYLCGDKKKKIFRDTVKCNAYQGEYYKAVSQLVYNISFPGEIKNIVNGEFDWFRKDLLDIVRYVIMWRDEDETQERHIEWLNGEDLIIHYFPSWISPDNIEVAFTYCAYNAECAESESIRDVNRVRATFLKEVDVRILRLKLARYLRDGDQTSRDYLENILRLGNT